MSNISTYQKAHWKCNDNDVNTTVLDSLGNHNAVASANTSTLYSASGKINSCFNMAGTKYFSSASHTDYNFAAGDASISVWVKRTGSVPGEEGVITKRPWVSGTEDGYAIVFTSNTNLRIHYYTDANFTVSSVGDGNWHHIVVTFNYTNHTSKVYYDGSYIGSANHTQDSQSNSDTLYVGRTNYNNGTQLFWNGSIDDVRILKGYELVQDDVDLLYNSGNGTESDFTDLNVSLDDSLTLSDSFELQLNPDTQLTSDSLSLNDSWDLITSLEPLSISDSLSLDDDWNLQINPDNQDVADSLSLNDNWSALVNPESQIIGDTLNLSDSYSFSKIFFHFLNTKLDWKKLYTNFLKLNLNWIIGKTINTSLTWLGFLGKTVNTDLRWLSIGYNDVPPIAPSNIQILINGVDMVVANDVDLQSGNIQHTIGQKSTASFTLARKHDDLDRTHAGAASQITNQNAVQIYIQGHLEFDGKISNLAVNSETETIQVTCLMDEPAQNRHTIDIPLPSVNEKIHLYHCLVNNVTIDNPYIDPGETNPEYYKGIKVDLGTKIQQQTDTWRDLESIWDGKGIIAASIEDGTFIPKPNYNYFWNVLAKNIRTGISNVDFRYIGTSLGSIATDLWVLNGASPLRQKIKDNLETILGYYYVGTAPYKEISSKNGQLIISAKYQDRDDGLYHVYDESYNYIEFAKLVAGLEYQKLLNINGTILPITSANIEITFDAYYYYIVKLLTRINVTNTTVANTFKNTNGFPTNVKGISINFSTMKITLTTDNRLSQNEIDEIDTQMPDEENPIYLVPERAVRVYRKFDLKTWSYVS